MAGFDSILKSVQSHQRVHKSLGLSTQLSEILRAQGRLGQSLSGISMLTELSKGMHQSQFKLKNHDLSVIQAMTSALSLQARYTIPKTTLDAITSINRQHIKLFGSLKSISEVLNKNQIASNQINSWHLAISGISRQLAAIATTQKKWDLIDNFEEITEEAVSLNQRIFDENGVTKEGLNELKEFFERIEIKVNKIDTDANALFWKLLALLGFILSLMGEVRNWVPKPEYATRKEVETTINNQFAIYNQKLKANKEFRITNRFCTVMLKPQLKSLKIEKLPIYFEVTVLQINHKWIYISYYSPKDNLPHTGWIMRKYLDTPE